MGKLDDKVAIVTGAGSGIGEATTKLFLEEGALVVAIDIEEKSLEKYKDNSKVLSIYGDVTSNGDIVRIIDDILVEHTGIDILCNMVISEELTVFAEKINNNLWDELVDLEVNGTFLLSKKVVEIMGKRNRGIILNVEPSFDKKLNYNNDHFEICKLTEVMAEGLWSKGIRTNCIRYGCTENDIKRILNEEDGDSDYVLNVKSRFTSDDYIEPIDIARTALFLCSDDSRRINGAIVKVDNGLSCL